MKYDFVITRDETTFGTDLVPTNEAYLDLTNVFFAPQYGINSEPFEAVAVAYHGPNGSPVVTMTFYLWDELTEQWYYFNTSVWNPGDAKWVSLPNIIDRGNTRQTARIAVAVVVTTPPGVLPAGDYTLALASSTAHFEEETEDELEEIIDWLEIIANELTPPLAVVGWEADDEPATVDPVLAGGKYIANPDASALSAPGDAGYLLLDVNRRIMARSRVEGFDVDNDPLTARPVVAGGMHIAVPAVLADGDAGHLWLDTNHRLMVSLAGTVVDVDATNATDDLAAPLDVLMAGGYYTATPSANPLEDGDAGRFLLDSIRRLMVRGVVEGVDADDDPLTANPLVAGGKFMTVPTQLESGDAGWLSLDTDHRLLVSLAGTSVTVTGTVSVNDPIRVIGVDLDDAPATVAPVLVGGKFIAGPDENPLSSANDAGYLLLDQGRRVMTRSRVEGFDLDDTALTARPVVAGGMYMTVPTQLESGDAGWLLLDADHKLMVNTGSSSVTNATDDVAAPLEVLMAGGYYTADPTANPLEDGDAGRLLLNELRMLINEDRVYDAPSDANRNMPVFIQADRGEVLEISGTETTLGTTQHYYYIDLTGFGFFACESYLDASAAPNAFVTITYQVSNEESEPDITLRDYTSDMSLIWFGSASYSTAAGATASYPHEKDTTTPWLCMRLKITTAAVESGTAAWTIRLRKIAH